VFNGTRETSGKGVSDGFALNQRFGLGFLLRLAPQKDAETGD
jgi:hypothetical protein